MSPVHFETRITRLLGIRHPILCGGLMWLADAAYVAAVVNAGGMGFISTRTFADEGRFRDELRKCRDLTGGKPFGVNLYLSQRAEQNSILDTHVDIILEAGVRVVETAGMPPTTLLAKLKEAGCTVIHKVAAVRHAVSAERLGVDAVTVVGAECGGHPGLHLVGSMVQAPLAAQSLSIPLAVGGGIGHGSQLAAALAMGADGVLLGTRMLVSREIWAHTAYKERIAAARETDTRLVLARFRNTYRALDNETAQAVAALEAEGVEDFSRYGPLVDGQQQYQAYASGDWDRGVLSMGQAAVFADRVEPAAAIISRFLDEAESARQRLGAAAGDGSVRER